MKKTLLFISFIFSIISHSQMPTIEWQKCFGGSSYEHVNGDDATSIIQTNDGGYALISSTKSSDGDVSNFSGDNFGDIWVIKIDSVSNLQWQICLGGNSNDFSYSIKETNDFGFLVMGFTQSNNGNALNYHGNGDLFLVKLNQNGSIVWNKCFGGSGFDETGKNNNGIYGTDFFPEHLIETSDAGFVILSCTRSNDGEVIGCHPPLTGLTYFQDLWLIKINYLGNIEFQKCIGGSNIDIPISLVKDSIYGGYLILSCTQSNDGDFIFNHGSIDIAVTKIDSTFNILWSKCLGGTNNDYASSIIQDQNGDLLISGLTASNNGDIINYHGGPADVCIFKLDHNGNIIWSKTYGGTGDEGSINSPIQNVKLIPSGNNEYIFSTITSSNDGDVSINYGSYDYWVAKIDALGSLIWNQSIGSIFDDHNGLQMNQSSADGEILIGFSNFNSSGNVGGSNSGYHDYFDIGLVKLASNGTILWHKCFGGSGIESITSTLFDNNNNVVFAGYTTSNNGDVTGNHGNYDLWICKLNQPITELSNKNSGNLFSIFPNPTSSQIVIESDETFINSSYSIYNSIGKSVLEGKINSKKTIIELADFEKGIYFFNFGENIKQTFKIALE
jgi:hypothetical protein